MHLHEIGYPSHLLSDFLTSILENNLVTRARPPKTTPLAIAEVRRDNALKKLSTGPYVSEIRTLTTIFQPLLPFPVLTPLPPLASIHQYSIRFHAVQDREYGVDNIHILVFVKSELYDEIFRCDITRNDIYAILDPDPEPHDTIALSEAAKNFRDSGVHVVTTFSWDNEKRTASFYMEDKVMEEMSKPSSAKHRWVCSIYRNDSYKDVTVPVGVRESVSKGDLWYDKGEKPKPALDTPIVDSMSAVSLGVD